MCICHLYVFIDEISLKVLGPFFNWFVFLLSFKSSLYILDNSCLSDVSFAVFSSQSVTCLTPLALSFAEWKFLILIKYYNLSILSIMDHV